MKKLFYLILATLILASPCFAAEGAVWSGVQSFGDGIRVVEIDFTLDTDGSTFEMDASMAAALKGWTLYYLEIDPGATAPQALYDLVLNNTYGIDVLGGNGANLSATASSSKDLIWPIVDQLSFVFSNNNVSDALVGARMVFYRSY